MKKISIIVPAYNEEESIPYLEKRLVALMNNMKKYEFEVLFVNDGSKDRTLELIKNLRERDERFCYVKKFWKRNCNDSRTRLCNR